MGFVAQFGGCLGENSLRQHHTRFQGWPKDKQKPLPWDDLRTLQEEQQAIGMSGKEIQD